MLYYTMLYATTATSSTTTTNSQKYKNDLCYHIAVV